MKLPKIPPMETVLYRERLLADAYYEFEDASAKGNVAGVAQSSIDMIRVIVGTLLEYGVPAEKIWDAVHAKNSNIKEAIYGQKSQEACRV